MSCVISQIENSTKELVTISYTNCEGTNITNQKIAPRTIISVIYIQGTFSTAFEGVYILSTQPYGVTPTPTQTQGPLTPTSTPSQTTVPPTPTATPNVTNTSTPSQTPTQTPTRTVGFTPTQTQTPTRTLPFTGNCVNCNYYNVQGTGYLTYTACSSSTNSYGLIQNSYIDTPTGGFIVINAAGTPQVVGSITITQLQPSGLACGTPPSATPVGPTPTNTPTSSPTPSTGSGQRISCLEYNLNTLSRGMDEANVNIYYTDCTTGQIFIQSMAPGLETTICSRSFPYFTADTKNVLINTSNNLCGNFVVNQTPEPTPTNTLTPNLYTVYQVQDCGNGYFYTVNVPKYSGLSIGNIISFNDPSQTCDITGQPNLRCGRLNAVLTNYYAESVSYTLFDSCETCSPSVTPTMTATSTITPTQTPTMPLDPLDCVSYIISNSGVTSVTWAYVDCNNLQTLYLNVSPLTYNQGLLSLIQPVLISGDSSVTSVITGGAIGLIVPTPTSTSTPQPTSTPTSTIGQTPTQTPSVTASPTQTCLNSQPCQRYSLQAISTSAGTFFAVYRITQCNTFTQDWSVNGSSPVEVCSLTVPVLINGTGLSPVVVGTCERVCLPPSPTPTSTKTFVTPTPFVTSTPTPSVTCPGVGVECTLRFPRLNAQSYNQLIAIGQYPVKANYTGCTGIAGEIIISANTIQVPNTNFYSSNIPVCVSNTETVFRNMNNEIVNVFSNWSSSAGPCGQYCIPPTPTPTISLTPSMTPSTSIAATSNDTIFLYYAQSGDTISLPYIQGGDYDGTIYWGDGTSSVNSYANRTHTYNNNTGTLRNPDFPIWTDPNNVRRIVIVGKVWGFSLKDVPLSEKIRFKGIQNWGNFSFYNNDGYYFNYLDLVTETTTLLYGIALPTTGYPLLTYSGGNITNMEFAFAGASPYGYSTTTNVPFDASNFNVSGITNMRGMFNFNWNTVSGLDYWDTSNVTNMSKMFKNGYSGDVTRWNTSSVTDLSEIFMYIGNFVSTPLSLASTGSSRWDVSNVTDFSRAFYGNNKFRGLNSSASENDVIAYWNTWQYWDVSSGENFDEMFRFAGGAQDFSGSTGVTISYTGWCTTNAQQYYNFSFGTELYKLKIIPPIWGTCPAPLPTQTPFATPSPTPTTSITPSPSVTTSVTPSVTITNTQTVSPTQTPTTTVTPSNSVTPTTTNTPSVSPTNTTTPTNTVSPTQSPSITPTSTQTGTPPPSGTNFPTPTPSVTNTQTPTTTVTPSNSVTPTTTNTPSVSPTNTTTPTVTNTPSSSGIVSYTYTNLGTGGSDTEACSESGNTFYGVRSTFAGLQIGDILYTDSGLTTAAVGFSYVSNSVINYPVDGGTGQIIAISALC